MPKRALIWLIPAVFYAFFFVWYTSFKGALSEVEIERYLTSMTAAGADPDQIALIEQFARTDSGRQFLMVNNIEMNRNPPDVAGAEPGSSSEQLMSEYMQYMFPALLSRASHPVLAGVAVSPSLDLVGIEGAQRWDQTALVRYRSRRDLLDIVIDPEFQARHEFKVAALSKTIAYPIEPVLYLSDPRLLLALILLALAALLDALLLSRANRIAHS
ncbi:MAG: hypothetical protein AAGF35_09850 [Pseudomonadota bacterium]